MSSVTLNKSESPSIFRPPISAEISLSSSPFFISELIEDLTSSLIITFLLTKVESKSKKEEKPLIYDHKTKTPIVTKSRFNRFKYEPLILK